jgi:hypothetical protein
LLGHTERDLYLEVLLVAWTCARTACIAHMVTKYHAII